MISENMFASILVLICFYHFRWFKDNREVTEDSNYYKENVIGLCRLVLTNVKPSDSGRYKVNLEQKLRSPVKQIK